MEGLIAAFDIPTGKLAAGDFPPNAKRLVESWTKLHLAELLANWDEAGDGKPIERQLIHICGCGLKG
jgi:hypothetical protein